MTNTNINHYNLAFIHTTITNFLTKEKLCLLKESYNALTFNHKKTDLFSFYQTAALNIDFLENYIADFLNKNQNVYKFTKQESNKNNAIKISFDIFASYYTKGSYLLLHDDSIDNRKIAFCLYLNDFDTGELLMYNEACDTEVKRIKVEENLFVMFGVEKAYHEVNYCDNDGRMAITGWLNWDDEVSGKNVLNDSFAKYIDVREKIIEKNAILDKTKIYDTSTNGQKNTYKIDPTDDIKVINDADIVLDTDFIGEEGPFYSRKVGRIVGSNTDIVINGYRLVTKNAYKLRIGDYILLNDVVNECIEDTIDVYYLKKVKADNVAVVKYVDENGEIEMEVECVDNTMFCIKRNKREIYIERMEHEVYIEHCIYKKK
ncbi:Prolyl 3-hydroxylase ogfod1 [Binucleata daphniae]